MNYLKIQLHLFIEKQRRINFFIKSKFVLKTALTNFQNISEKKTWMTLTIKLKINIKRYDDVTTTFNDCSKNFKHVRRKFFKHRKKKFNLQMKNLNVKKKFKKRKTRSFFKIICYICQKKNTML